MKNPDITIRSLNEIMAKVGDPPFSSLTVSESGHAQIIKDVQAHMLKPEKIENIRSIWGFEVMVDKHLPPEVIILDGPKEMAICNLATGTTSVISKKYRTGSLDFSTYKELS